MNELNRNKGQQKIWVLVGAVALASVAGAQSYNQPGYGNQPVYGQQTYGQPGYDDSQAGDPPSRVARVSVVVGNVSFEPASVQQFSAAETNYPMTSGDRIYADLGANAEIQTGQLAVRMGQQTDLTVSQMTDAVAQFGLAQGSVHLRSYDIYQGEIVELDTPNVSLTVLEAGDVRVDVDGSGNTAINVLSGQVQVDGNGVQEVLSQGERIFLVGSNPVQTQNLRGMRPDGLDRFSQQRDSMYQNAYASEQDYVNPGTIGAEDLAAYGSWDNDSEYGAVWYPTSIDVGWQPYRNGHWAYVGPWGWTWIGAEPWGFAPFHYGRWNRFVGRWGWIPGPPVVRPVYSPALVAFVGGGGFGAGVTAWFPLGPREVYQPWYRASDRYVNRVNVSNIYNRDSNQVRSIYNQRNVVNIYANGGNRNYVNRMGATVAISQDNFAGGRRVDQSMVRLNQQQMAGGQVMSRPPVVERMMGNQPAARAVPPRMQRPVLASQGEVGRRQEGGGPRMQGGPQRPQGQQPFQQQQGRFPQQGQPQPGQSQPGPQRGGQGQSPQGQPQPVQQQPQRGGQQSQQPGQFQQQPQGQNPQGQNPQGQRPQQGQPAQQVPQQPAPVQPQPGRGQQQGGTPPQSNVYNPHQVVEGDPGLQNHHQAPQQPVQEQPQQPVRTQPQQPVQQPPQQVPQQPPAQQPGRFQPQQGAPQNNVYNPRQGQEGQQGQPFNRQPQQPAQQQQQPQPQLPRVIPPPQQVPQQQPQRAPQPMQEQPRPQPVQPQQQPRPQPQPQQAPPMRMQPPVGVPRPTAEPARPVNPAPKS